MRLDMVREQMGTPIQMVVVTEDERPARDAMEAAFAECERIEKTYSRFLEGNELAAVNARVGEWTEVSEELYGLLVFAEDVKARTEGAFDVTVKSILEGWGYDRAYSLKENVPGHTGRVELAGGRVRISAPIELGGLGKGYALDRMAAILSEFPNVHLNAGGDILVRGVNEEGKPWRIVFEDPCDITKGIGFVESSGLSLASSSPSRRRWRNRHHLVDPRKVEPANEMLAVYTQASSALVADVYSTALFVLGYEEAKKLLPELPVEAMLISPEGKILRSKCFQGILF